MKDSEQNWTPVVRKRKTSKTMHTKESTSTSSSDSELDIGTGNQVHSVSSWQRGFPFIQMTLEETKFNLSLITF